MLIILVILEVTGMKKASSKLVVLYMLLLRSLSVHSRIKTMQIELNWWRVEGGGSRPYMLLNNSSLNPSALLGVYVLFA